MCDCIKNVDEMLATRNTRLSIPMILSFKGEEPKPPTLFVQTEQIEKGRGKAKATAMFATFCPFCGAKYTEEEAVQ